VISEGRSIPVVSADSRTILNVKISPTARLLYVVLLAFHTVAANDPALPGAIGLDPDADLTEYLDELAEEGVVEVIKHRGIGVRITVHQMAVSGADRVHACKTCPDCDVCVCEAYHCLPYCDSCGSVREARRAAEKAIAHWQKRLDAGAVYALGQHATKLHRWDCKSLNTVEAGLAAIEEGEARGEGAYWPRLPDLFTVGEMRAKPKRYRGCQLCKPDPV
jgi:hypothetical protein